MPPVPIQQPERLAIPCAMPRAASASIVVGVFPHWSLWEWHCSLAVVPRAAQIRPAPLPSKC